MRAPSASLNLGLKALSKLFSVILFLCILLNAPIVSAQEASCPIPPDTKDRTEVIGSFLNSECQKVIIQEPKVFYRYYNSNGKYKYGRYLTTEKFTTNIETIRYLALNQEWGKEDGPNQATSIETVTLPAGTPIYVGLTAPVTPAECYPGHGQQTFIENTRDPNIQWSDGQPMIVLPFSCP